MTEDRPGVDPATRSNRERQVPDPNPDNDKWPDDHMLEAAWGIIANANGGNWDEANPEWRGAAIRWRDAYHAALGEVAPPDRLRHAHKVAEQFRVARDEARAEVDRLRADLADARRVIEQLKRYHYNDDTGYCNEDGFVWPCRTFRALSAGGGDRTEGDEP